MSKNGLVLIAFLLAPLCSIASSPPYDYGLCKSVGNQPSDGPKAMEFFSFLIAYNLNHLEDHGGVWLENYANEWNNPACILDDGRPRLSALTLGYDRAFDSEKDWSKSLQRVRSLREKYPQSAFSVLAEVQYWISFAWDARGSGYASTVTPEGWRLFRERMEKAESVLIETKSYSTDFPVWYEQMIIVQSALDRPPADREKTFFEGAKRFNAYYPLYFTRLNYLSPKWGGSWELVNKFIEWAVENTRASEGESMYARLSWSAYGGSGGDARFFSETKLSWAKIKKGFEDLMVRHPNSNWNLNNFAKFSCMAEDKKTFLLLRGKIDKNIIPEAWPKQISLDLCDHKFGYLK